MEDNFKVKRKGSIVERFLRLNQTQSDSEEKQAERNLSAKLTRADAISSSELREAASHKPKTSVRSAAIDSVLDSSHKDGQDFAFDDAAFNQELNDKMQRIDKIKSVGPSSHHQNTRGAIAVASIGTHDKSHKSQEELDNEDDFDIKMNRIEGIKPAKGAVIAKRSATHHGAVLSEAMKR